MVSMDPGIEASTTVELGTSGKWSEVERAATVAESTEYEYLHRYPSDVVTALPGSVTWAKSGWTDELAPPAFSRHSQTCEYESAFTTAYQVAVDRSTWSSYVS